MEVLFLKSDGTFSWSILSYLSVSLVFEKSMIVKVITVLNSIPKKNAQAKIIEKS